MGLLLNKVKGFRVFVSKDLIFDKKYGDCITYFVDGDDLEKCLDKHHNVKKNIQHFNNNTIAGLITQTRPHVVLIIQKKKNFLYFTLAAAPTMRLSKILDRGAKLHVHNYFSISTLHSAWSDVPRR